MMAVCPLPRLSLNLTTALLLSKLVASMEAVLTPSRLVLSSAIGKEPGQKTFIEYAIDYSKANAPPAQDLYSDDVGNSGLFLCSPLAHSITGVTLYVDNDLNYMGMALDSEAMKQ